MVDIIMPCYNQVDTLERAIKSVLAQTYKDWTLVIIDDFSKYNPQLLVDELLVVNKLDDNRIIFLRNSKNLGASATRNIGIRETSSEYVAFLDADDTWEPTKLEKQIRMFWQSLSSRAVISCGYYYANDTGIIGQRRLKYSGLILNHLLFANCVCGSSVVRREVLEEVGCWTEGFSSCQDWDLWLKIAEKNYTFGFVDEPLMKWYQHPGQAGANLQKKIKGVEMILENHKELYVQNPKALAFNQMRLAGLYGLSAVRTDKKSILQIPGLVKGMLKTRYYFRRGK